MNGIYICPTPIGNMEDITLRVLRTLKECDCIACEDTRHTAVLLQHFDIRKPLVSYHKFNEEAQAAALVQRALMGQSIAVVSDAGMPGISDPGFTLVCAARKAGVPVTVLPGANAAVCALVLSGLPCARFVFEGFLPAEGKVRRERIEHVMSLRDTAVLYEAPHRLARTLDELAAVDPYREVAVCRELSKLHEECCVIKLGESREFLQQHPPRGEYVLGIRGAEPKVPQGSLEEQLAGLLAQGVPRKEAVKTVAKANGVSKNEVYMLTVNAESSGREGR